MGEPKKVGLAVAMAGGYVLGRSKKGRTALTAAAVLLGSGLNPRDLVGGGGRKDGGGPEGEDSGGTIGREFAQVVRTAAATVANRRVTAFTEALHERTVALSEEHDSGGEDSSEEDSDGEDSDEADSGEQDSPSRKPR